MLARPPLSDLVSLTLSHGPYEVEVSATSGAAGERKRTWRPHLLIVDIDVRDGDPNELIGEVIAGRKIPTIVLTKRGDLRTKLGAFDRGADDFLSLPMSPDELLARVVALIRRTYGEGLPLVAVIRIAELEIDLLDREVRSGGRTVRLTTTEQSLLYLLAANAGRTLAREAILDTLWGSDYIAESNLIDRHIRNLRLKLHDDSRKPRFIFTIPGKGYRFVARSEPPT